MSPVGIVGKVTEGDEWKIWPSPEQILIRVRDIIASVKQVKARPDEQILVSGIIGWPLNGDVTGVQYRIDKDLTASTPDQREATMARPTTSATAISRPP